MLNNRIVSFMVILFVYIIAAFCGFIFFDVLHYDYRLSLLVADILATVIVFAFSLILRNASVYDPYWSVQPIVILIGFAVRNNLVFTLPNLNLLGILLLCVVCGWGLRLTANWCYTFKNLNWQDWRYSMLKEKTGKLYPFVNFAGIHMFPTLVVYLCILPAVTAITEGFEFKPLCIPFLLLSTAAFIIQGIADFQMHRFRKRGEGTFIREGLWKHSRHPNYLGEILMWWGIGLACVAAKPEQWYLLAGAVLNTCLFLFVSIPMAEKHQSRKEGFEEYKKQTRILI